MDLTLLGRAPNVLSECTRRVTCALLCISYASLLLAQPGIGPRTEMRSSGFMENRGQMVDQFGAPNTAVRYLLHAGRGLNVQIRANGFSYDTFTRRRSNADTLDRTFHRIDVSFVGSMENAWIEPIGCARDRSNFYTKGTADAGVLNVHHYGKVIVHDIYPNIDVMFTSSSEERNSFKYDLLLHPGARLEDIHLSYVGTSTVALRDEVIVLGLGDRTIRERIPLSYWADGKRVVDITYRVEKMGTEGMIVGFEGWSGPVMEDLVIDPSPELDWGTYVGGNESDYVQALALDTAGYLYAGGYTTSTVGLATAGAFQGTFGGDEDALLAKYDAAGSKLWATYIGGTGEDKVEGVATYGCEALYAVGYTTSESNIATPGAHQIMGANDDAGMIMRFDTSGARIWGTYYGGGYDQALDVAVGGTGDLVIAGWAHASVGIATNGSFQPARSGPSDAMLVKFDPNGVRLWGTYFGGPDHDQGTGVDVDQFGNIYFVGFTYSTTGIATPGAQDEELQNPPAREGFIARFDPDGDRVWATYYGGETNDEAYEVKVAGPDEIYVLGETQSSSGIGTPGVFLPESASPSLEDLFVLRLNDQGMRQWCTYVGGEGADEGTAFDVVPGHEGGARIYAGGQTWSQTGISTPGAYQEAFIGEDAAPDVFVTALDGMGQRIWSTYYGGPHVERMFAAVADEYGGVYVAGITQSPVGISTPGSDQEVLNGEWGDGFIAHFLDGNLGVAYTEPEENGLLVFPIPSAGDVHLSSTMPCDCSLFDVAGRWIRSFSLVPANEHTEDLRALPEGSYTVECSSPRMGMAHRQIIISRK